MEQDEAVKRMLLRKFLTKPALERLGRVRLANPVLASQLETYLVQAYASGQIKQVTDEELKKILELLTKKRETKIRRV
ncbi:MAG: hypothetical protein GXO63_01790 [Candidatus Micrarchaeota archaeon]|nr:hypothetical protein [Candidatus Micrarchaeota archaeon]